MNGKFENNDPKAIDMRVFAKSAGANIRFGVGNIIFNRGDAGQCMYIVQSGVIEMVIGDKVVETCGENEAIGFMSMVDGALRSSTARVKQDCEVSVIDARTFRFMVDEVPNFAMYIMGAMARRIRGMGRRHVAPGLYAPMRIRSNPDSSGTPTRKARGRSPGGSP